MIYPVAQPLRFRVRRWWRTAWPAGTVLLLVLGLCVLAVWSLGCCGSAGSAIGSALEGAAVTMDRVERTEGNAAIDTAQTREQAEAELAAIRERYRPAWVALAVALQADVAYLEDCAALPALVAAYCALGKAAPTLKLPPIVPCEVSP